MFQMEGRKALEDGGRWRPALSSLILEPGSRRPSRSSLWNEGLQSSLHWDLIALHLQALVPLCSVSPCHRHYAELNHMPPNFPLPLEGGTQSTQFFFFFLEATSI